MLGVLQLMEEIIVRILKYAFASIQTEKSNILLKTLLPGLKGVVAIASTAVC